MLHGLLLYLFPWLGSLLGGWCVVEAILPPHRWETLSAVLTLLWAFGCYPLYCRLAARAGLDPVRIVAFYCAPGVLGVMVASVCLFGWLPVLGTALAVLHPVLQLPLFLLQPADNLLIVRIVLGRLLWFAPVAALITHHRKD